MKYCNRWYCTKQNINICCQSCAEQCPDRCQNSSDKCKLSGSKERAKGGMLPITPEKPTTKSRFVKPKKYEGIKCSLCDRPAVSNGMCKSHDQIMRLKRKAAIK